MRAAYSIKDGREIEILIIDGPAKMSYTFTKKGGKNLVLEGVPSSADLTFTLPKKSADEIIHSEFDSIGQIGLRIFEKMLSEHEDQKIKVKLHAGFLSLMTGGYFGVLTAGGSEVASFLAMKGLASMGKIKDTISKMKSGT